MFSYSLRVIAIFLVTALSLLAVMPTDVAQADLQSGIKYVMNQTLDDWAAQALVAANQTVSDQTFLDTFTDTGTTAIEKRILTLAALDSDPRTKYANRDLVQELMVDHYSDNQIGDSSFVNDDMWGVLALASVHETGGLVFSDAVAFIVNNQNADGGWSYAVGADSDTNDTAVAVMALLEAGYSSSDQVITDALAYLTSTQNADGGWGFVAGSDSDSASTSWVVSALTKAGQTVDQATRDFLWSLQTEDGSFKWVASDENGSLYMTSQALIALSDSYFPVATLTTGNQGLGNHLRIEGSSEQYCDEMIVATTALDIVEQGASVCGYTYNIEQTSFGPYLNQINDDLASGTEGWMYRVNWEMPTVGAADYILEPDDEVLWYFGEFTLIPLKLSVSSEQVGVGDTVTVEVDYFDDTTNTFVDAVGAIVSGADQQYTTDNEGRVAITLDSAGIVELVATKAGYVRSNATAITVGDGVSQTVGWEVTVVDNGGGGGDPVLSFAVNTDNVNFGDVEKGYASASTIGITNDGTMDVYIEGIVSGNQDLVNLFKINDMHWEDYNDVIDVGMTHDVEVEVMIPGDFGTTGQQVGDIVFWGTAAN